MAIQYTPVKSKQTITNLACGNYKALITIICLKKSLDSISVFPLLCACCTEWIFFFSLDGGAKEWWTEMGGCKVVGEGHDCLATKEERDRRSVSYTHLTLPTRRTV